MESNASRYEFIAEPFHCDFSHHLFLGHLGNHLLNASVIPAVSVFTLCKVAQKKSSTSMFLNQHWRWQNIMPN
jgi:hypothetical protein